MSESIDDLMPPAPYNEQPTLRDRFAMAALTGICANPDMTRASRNAKGIVEYALMLADACMEARKKMTDILHDYPEYTDERQQQDDGAEQQERLEHILRYAMRRPLRYDEIALLCVGCGIDVRGVT